MKLHKSETHSRVKHGFFTPIHDLQDINLVPLSQYCSIMFDTFSRSDKTWVACSICAQVEEQWHKTQIIYIYIYLKMFELISHGRGRTLFANIFLNVPKGQQSNSAFEIFELLEIYMILVGKC